MFALFAERDDSITVAFFYIIDIARAAMDEYQIMSLLMRLEMQGADPATVATLYAQTLAEASPQLTDEQLRRFLLCGAYICHGRDRNAGGPASYSAATPSGRSSIELPSDDPSYIES